MDGWLGAAEALAHLDGLAVALLSEVLGGLVFAPDSTDAGRRTLSTEDRQQRGAPENDERIFELVTDLSTSGRLPGTGRRLWRLLAG